MTDITIHVTDHQGNQHSLKAPEGWRLMEVIRDYNIPINAECGGACSCATCHIYVDEAWLSKLHDANDEEIAMLDEAFEVEDNSRLSCQIITSSELDGIKVTLAPGSEVYSISNL